jgi:hypothetical protein
MFPLKATDRAISPGLLRVAESVAVIGPEKVEIPEEFPFAAGRVAPPEFPGRIGVIAPEPPWLACGAVGIAEPLGLPSAYVKTGGMIAATIPPTSPIYATLR